MSGIPDSALFWAVVILGGLAVYFLERICMQLIAIKRLLAHQMGQNVD